MKNRTLYIITITIMVLCFGDVLCAGSIWAKRNSNKKGLYADDVARQIGDILTILVKEDGEVKNKIKRELSKTTTRNSAWDGTLGIKTPNHNLLPTIPALNIASGTGSGATLTGKSKFDDERSITDEITVVVEDVLPNGNLVVFGFREREVAGDSQTMETSGIVRPSDITFANTVSSEQVANFKFVLTNKGPSETYNRVGWLGKIMDSLWPF